MPGGNHGQDRTRLYLVRIERAGAEFATPAGVARVATRFWIPILLVLALFSAAPARAGTTDSTDVTTESSREDPRTLIRALNAQLAAGRTDSAMTICRHYLTLYPDDAGMRYNLACLQEAAGDREQALAELSTALAGGYDDFHQIAADDDLVELIADPRFAELRAARETELAALSAAVALTLTAGERLQSIPLGRGSADRHEGAETAGTLGLRFAQGALEIELAVDDPAFRAGAPPWRGGSGAFVNIVVPDSAHRFESDIVFSFAFGMFQRRTTGAVYIPGDGNRWQRVAELAPKIRIDEQQGRVHLSALIPWRALAPYHPLVDSELGLNVVYQSFQADGRRWTAALVADPGVASAAHRWRRYVPLTLQPSHETDAQLAGRLSSSVVTDGQLGLDLVAWVPVAGSGHLTVAVTDAAGQSVLTGGPRRQQQQLSAGLVRWQREADLSALPTGPYAVEAALELPDGATVTWHGQLLRLTADWLATAREQLGSVAPVERATVAYRIEAVARALHERQPRQDASPLITTVGEIELMFRQVESTGSILPAAGQFLMVYPGSEAQEQLCSLQLTAGHGPGTPLVVVLPGAAPTAATLARQIAQQLPSGTHLTVAVPHLPPAAADPEAATRQAAAALAWLHGYLDPGSTRLAGVNAGAGTALSVSLADPDALSGVMLIAGGGFAPWPQSSPAQLQSDLDQRHNELRYDWIRFTAETRSAGQADSVHETMIALGFRIGTDEQVAGGLSISQASGRIAAWAARR